jgi:hypothetical protein
MKIIDVGNELGGLYVRTAHRIPRDPFIRYWRSRLFQMHTLCIGRLAISWRVGPYRSNK